MNKVHGLTKEYLALEAKLGKKSLKELWEMTRQHRIYKDTVTLDQRDKPQLLSDLIDFHPVGCTGECIGCAKADCEWDEQ